MYNFSRELTDTGHHRVVALVREKLKRSKQAALKYDVNLISGSIVSLSLGQNIRLRCETGL
jgi:hypothetical protein